jgi:hypothetical protein
LAPFLRFNVLREKLHISISMTTADQDQRS